MTFILILWMQSAFAQQTVFNVPTSDILSAKANYSEVDLYHEAWTFRTVHGVGSEVEAGLNIGVADSRITVASLPLKWRVVQKSSWAMVVGGESSLSNGIWAARGYSKCDVLLAERIRVGLGGYAASRDFYQSSPVSGLLATVEASLTSQLSLASDFVSGNHSGGQFSGGLIIQFLGGTHLLYLAYNRPNSGGSGLLAEYGFHW